MSWPLSWSVCFRCSLCLTLKFSVLCPFLSLFISPTSFIWILNLSLSCCYPVSPSFLSFFLPAFAFVGERERAVPRPPLVVPHRVRHVETLPRPPHPPRVWRLCWHHITLLCTSAAKLHHHRYTTHTQVAHVQASNYNCRFNWRGHKCESLITSSVTDNK